ncbi:DUF6461 domain-containing protein [Streptomyces sp. NPDC057950]|uniref:DUF6461 domain-containing protein n=1 Tax=Streptomyces sp. NPDC057950 TaxID=3346288 RepID=UPI0036DFB57D
MRSPDTAAAESSWQDQVADRDSTARPEVLREVGLPLTSDGEHDEYAPDVDRKVDRKAAVLALAERLTGIRVTESLLQDAHRCPGGAPAQGMDLRGDRDGVGPRTGEGERAGDHLRRFAGHGSFAARGRRVTSERAEATPARRRHCGGRGVSHHTARRLIRCSRAKVCSTTQPNFRSRRQDLEGGQGRFAECAAARTGEGPARAALTAQRGVRVSRSP